MKQDKKKSIRKKKDPKDYIITDPVLKERTDRTVVVSFGRLNPITVGHEKLVNRVINEAIRRKADAAVYVSHSQDPKKNPLSYDQKVAFAQTAFGKVVKRSKARTMIEVAKELSGKYANLVVVVGQDRVAEFDRMLNKYNGREYNFENIEIISAGDRDPDADDVTGMSASKMRSFAAMGDFEMFRSGLPKRLQSRAKSVYDAVRAGMGIKEDLDESIRELEELAPLTIAQRRKRGLQMKRYRTKIKAARERAKRRMASKEKLLKRSRRRALDVIRTRLMKNKKYSEMTPAEKIALDKRLAKISPRIIDRIAKRLFPKVRAAEKERLAGVLRPKQEDVNDVFEAFLEERMNPQDPDVKDLPGSQPKGYYRGVKKSVKDDRARHFRKHAKMSDDDPAAYKPAPGDKRAETRPSIHTKKFKQMYGEEVLDEASIRDNHIEYTYEDMNELYTVGHTKTYDSYFAQHQQNKKDGAPNHLNPPPHKLGINRNRVTKAANPNPKEHEPIHKDQTGSAFKTAEEAKNAIRKKKSFSVYKLKGDFNKNTVYHNPNTGYHHLYKDTEISHKVTESVREEVLDEASIHDTHFRKRPHMALEKNGSVKFDKRFKIFRKKEQINESPEDILEQIFELKEAVEAFAETKLLDESNIKKTLQDKAQKAGVSYSIVKDVYDRGVAAWKSGHRPGTTPSQWGVARVNSFLTGGKTRTTADADLWRKHQGKSESYGDLDENVTLDRVVDKIRERVAKTGLSPVDIAYEIVSMTGINFNPRQLEKRYRERFGQDEPKPGVSKAREITLRRRYGLATESVQTSAAKQRIQREKEADKQKHARMLASAKIRDIRSKMSSKINEAELSPSKREDGTDSLVKTYKKDTPGEKAEAYYGSSLGNDYGPFEKGSRIRFTDHSMDMVDGDIEKEGTVVGSNTQHLRVRDDAGMLYLVRHSDATPISESVLDEQKDSCPILTVAHMQAFEKFVDRMFEKFGIDFDFTKHFRERMSDERNDPCIDMKELATMIQKIYRRKVKGDNFLSKHKDAEIVIKDLQSDLNMPVAIEYDRKNDEIRVVSKTIMRKKNFRTPNPVVKV
jgi:nicotinic acid mononucleotide adenylyltransferase